MASGMKYWLTAVAVGITLVMIWQLPPASSPLHERVVKKAEAAVFEELRREVRFTSETLRRYLWSDSLTALVFEREVDGVGHTYIEGQELDSGQVLPFELNTEQVLRFEEKVRGEVDEARRGNAEMVFGYVFQHSQQNARPNTGNLGRTRVETFAGSFEGRPYCLQVRVGNPREMGLAITNELSETDNVRPRTTLLGECAFYLRYGLPGDGIRQWVESGGAFHAIEQAGAGRPPQLPTWEQLRAPFGFGLVGMTNRPIEADQCLAGDGEACGWLLANPGYKDRISANDLAVAAASPATSLGSYRSGDVSWTSRYSGMYLLSDLETEMGFAAFDRFWKSEAAFDVAFEDAFATDPGSWMLTWLAQSTRIYPPGPGLPRSATSGSMLTIALLLGIAWSFQRRRRVV